MGNGVTSRRSSSRGQRRILIITHDEKFAEHFERLLSINGDIVTLAFTGQEGLNCARQSSPELVVLDMYLKNPSGSEVLQSLREQGFTGKIILLAGLSVSPLVPKAMRFGIERVMGMPLTLGPLECAIRSALDTSEKETTLSTKHQQSHSVKI